MIITTFNTKEKVDEFVNLAAIFFNETSFNDLTFNAQQLAQYIQVSNPNSYSAAYEVDNKIVGILCAYYHTMPFIVEPVSTELFLYVTPEYRSTHVANELRIAYEEWSKTRRAKLCLFGSNTGINPEATHKFITKNGYIMYGTNYKKEL